MDRTPEMITALNKFRTAWMSDKVKRCRTQEEPGLLMVMFKILAKCHNKIAESQEVYISLFHLKSSIWTGTCEYKIVISDSMLYLDNNSIYENWIPQFIYADVKNLEDAIEKELSKRFVRLAKYEVVGVMRAFLMDYQKIAEVYWRQAGLKFIQSDEFIEFQNKDWKILCGNYFGNINIILESENGR